MKEVGHTDLTQEALLRAAREIVASAIAGDFPADPLIARDLSRGISAVGSLVKRHGWVLQNTLAKVLAANGRFVVWTDVPLPLTKAAKTLIAAKNSGKDLARIRLPANSEIDRMVTVDLIVVEPVIGWAGVYEVKRGNGATETRKRLPTEQMLQAARLVLPSFLEKLGYDGITTVTSAVIDYYGASGFNPEVTLTRDQLDDHFGVPVIITVDAMTTALRDAFELELPRLFGPFIAGLNRMDGPAAPTVANGACRDGNLPDEVLAQIFTARPVGPGPRRTDGVCAVPAPARMAPAAAH